MLYVIKFKKFASIDLANNHNYVPSIIIIKVFSTTE